LILGLGVNKMTMPFDSSARGMLQHVHSLKNATDLHKSFAIPRADPLLQALCKYQNQPAAPSRSSSCW
ncbi:MAG: hypothetical protein KGR46_12540, partial [Verrucomicrobia bacterium]|nr:hypothetical protein [Verrucomicrobiota bacterium]